MSQFIYLLNAFEQASQSSEPFKAKYAEKRKALLDYVAKLEAPRPEAAATDTARLDWVCNHSDVADRIDMRMWDTGDDYLVACREAIDEAMHRSHMNGERSAPHKEKS